MTDLVVQTRPETLKRGNVEQDRAARFQFLANRPQSRVIVIDVLKDVEREDERRRLVRHGSDVPERRELEREQPLPLRCVRFDANDVVTILAKTLRERSDAGPKVDQLFGIRRLANQADQIIVVVASAFERLKEIDS